MWAICERDLTWLAGRGGAKDVVMRLCAQERQRLVGAGTWMHECGMQKLRGCSGEPALLSTW